MQHFRIAADMVWQYQLKAKLTLMKASYTQNEYVLLTHKITL